MRLISSETSDMCELCSTYKSLAYLKLCNNRVDVFIKYFKEQNEVNSRRRVSYTFVAPKSLTCIYL